MGSHPINLTIRFLLEMAALLAFGFWGWKQTDGVLRFVLALGIPIVLAAIWGIFAVPNDPSRSGSAPVATLGILRLVLELAFFVFAAWCFKQSGHGKISLIFSILVIIHYLASYDRIGWLIRH